MTPQQGKILVVLLLAIALGICGALLFIVTNLKSEPDDTRSAAEKAKERRAHLRALGLLAGLAVYVILLPVLGYPIAIGLLVGAAAVYGGTALGPRVPLIAGIGGLGFWLVFDKALGITMPLGAWLGP